MVPIIFSINTFLTVRGRLGDEMKTPVRIRMKAGLSRVLKSGLLVVLLASSPGCETLLTEKLWRNERLTTYCEAAESARLEVRADPVKHDYLISYDEAAEQRARVNRRAYWLRDNLDRIGHTKRPRFATKADMERMARVNPLPIQISAGEGSFVILLSHDTFTIHETDREDGPHTLPVYRSRSGMAAKLALTPVAAAADLTVIGAAVGATAAVGLAASGVLSPSRP